MNFYRDASLVLVRIEQELGDIDKVSGSLKTVVFQSCKEHRLNTDGKQIYAILSSYLKVKEHLDAIIRKSGMLKNIPIKKGKAIFTNATVRLLVYDMLVSKKKRIQMGKHRIKSFVLKHQVRLKGELGKYLVKMKVRSLAELMEENGKDMTPVRWIRINPSRCGGKIEEVVGQLSKDFPREVDDWKELVPGSIYKDVHIPNLYGIDPSDKITKNELYKQGKIMIQDRASCFPAHILNPSARDVVIDTCSAPGNKTIHAAAHIFNNTQPTEIKIHAFERDPERAKTLRKMVEMAGVAKGVKIHVGDFTRLGNPEELKDVTGFIVDPSCSGSGIFCRQVIDKVNEAKIASVGYTNEISREEETLEEKKRMALKNRLAKLSSFQFEIVKHAMSFPSAKKLVYSTCSIHAEENERVVIDLLLDNNVKENGWRVASKDHVLPSWPRRGLVSEFEEVFATKQAQELANGCIRALPREDGGIGFFAVCFIRD